MATSDDNTNHDQEPGRYVHRPDYWKVALAYEQRLAEVGGGDALLDTLKATLDAYEFDIRQRGRENPRLFPDRLHVAGRMAGAFKSRADRDELGAFMNELLEDFDLYQAETERRIENAAHGTLPEGVESALLNVRSCTHILWTLMGETSDARAPTAEERDLNSSIDYAVEQLRENVRALSRAVYGFEDDGDDDGEDLAA